LHVKKFEYLVEQLSVLPSYAQGVAHPRLPAQLPYQYGHFDGFRPGTEYSEDVHYKLIITI
jgi:hypothetical protein